MLLADPEIDVVVNLTPIQAHFETGMAVLEAGKHLYSEKPLAMAMDQARSAEKLLEQGDHQLLGLKGDSIGRCSKHQKPSGLNRYSKTCHSHRPTSSS